VKFRLLGRLEVEADGVDLTPVRPQQRALLALLLLHAGEVVAVDALVDGLWGARAPETAQKALQGHISALRKQLGAERIETRRPGYRLQLAEDDELDIQRFEQIVAAARTDGAPGRLRKLCEALTLFRGEPLADFRYEEFAGPEAVRLQELRLTVVEEQIDAELALERHAEVVPELERLVVDHPLRERMRAQLMLALYRAGRQVDALQAFQETRTRFVDELGIDPSPALQRLERQILNHDPELAAPEPVSPKRKLAATRGRLPPQPTSFIGREREIEEVTDLLRRPAVRLVTLTGTGGTGKTRIALQTAAGLLDTFADGDVFIALAPLQDPDLVLTTTAQAVGVGATSGETSGEELARVLRDRELLLVFDNFEHLVVAAPSVADVVARAPGVKLLVTSRAPLRLSAEHVYPVSPLATPGRWDSEDVDLLLRCESVALFESRAQAVQPHFAVTSANAGAIAEVCRALDGLPLAIELAASRIGTLPAGAMRRRLDHRLELLVGGVQDAPERQRTLRATIDWSYDLLEPPEQRLFTRLAVFAGGCTIEAAQRVCGDELEVVDGLASLTERGLTRLEGSDEEPRFTMLETIREYAVELFERSGEVEEIQRRHAEYCLALVAQAAPTLESAGNPVAIMADFENLRGARRWLDASGDTLNELSLVASLRDFWLHWVHFPEGRAWFAAALAKTGDIRTPVRVKALGGAGWLASAAGDLEEAESLARQSLELARELGDLEGIGYALHVLGNVALSRGDAAEAVELYEESAQYWRQLGAKRFLSRAFHNIGLAAYSSGDFVQSRAMLEESLVLARELRDPGTLVNQGLAELALLEVAADRPNEALPLLRESLERADAIMDKRTIAWDLIALAAVAVGRGEAATAARLLGSGFVGGQAGTSTGDFADSLVAPFERDFHAGVVAAARAIVSPEVFDAERAVGRAMNVEEALEYALAAVDKLALTVDKQRNG
jgi:predicted ATPase/DNA-binding SARP family transcriptional activator